MNRFRKIFISVMLTFILATGCGAANAAPTQQVEQTTAEQTEQVVEEAVEQTTAEQAEQVAEEAVEQTKAEYNEEERRVYFPDGLYMIWDHDRPPTDEELEELLKFWKEHTEK